MEGRGEERKGENEGRGWEIVGKQEERGGMRREGRRKGKEGEWKREGLEKRREY